MRVVQLGPVPPPHGGVSSNMLAIHEALARAGHDSVIIDVTNRSADNSYPNVIKPRSALGLITKLMAIPADVIHYHIGGEFTARLAGLTLLCGLMPGKRSVVTFHSGGFAQNALSSARPFSVHGTAFRSVDAVIGVNAQMIEMFRSFGVNGDRAKLIPPYELRRPDPNVVVPPQIDHFVRRFEPLLLSVGALEPEYQNELIIKAMPELLQKRPNAGLLIVGSGSCESSVRQLVDRLSLSDRVMLSGNVEPAVALHLIERASVLLRVTKFDGDAISVREAIHLGTPVVASDNAHRPIGVFLLSSTPAPQELIEAVMKAEGAQVPGHLQLTDDSSNAERVIEVYKELFYK